MIWYWVYTRLGGAQDRHGTPPDGSGNGTDGTQGVVQLRLTLFLFNNGGGAIALLAAATLATLDDTAFLARAVLASHGRSDGQRGDSESGKSLVLHGEEVSDEGISGGKWGCIYSKDGVKILMFHFPVRLESEASPA